MVQLIAKTALTRPTGVAAFSCPALTIIMLWTSSTTLTRLSRIDPKRSVKRTQLAGMPGRKMPRIGGEFHNATSARHTHTGVYLPRPFSRDHGTDRGS